MLGKAMLVSMIEYHRQVNERLLELAATLADADLDEPIAGSGRSIRVTFRHLVATDNRWRIFLETRKRTWVDGSDDQPGPIAEIAEQQSNESAALTTWLASQDEGDLLQQIEIVWDGETHTMAPWQGLLQLLMHGQQHRAEIALALSRLGKSPNDVDYIMYA